MNHMGGRVGYRERETFMVQMSWVRGRWARGRSVGRPVLDGCERVSTTSRRRMNGALTFSR